MFFSSRKKASISSFVYIWENKGIMLQTLRGKQKYQVTNVGVEKVKLSRLPVQRINDRTNGFKMNEIQRKTSEQSLKPSWQRVIVSYFWALNQQVTFRQQMKTYLQSCITLCIEIVSL